MPQRKVLVGDGDRNAAMALAGALRRQGWEPLAASDATMVLAVAMKSRPDAIVLSARLPGGALETLKRLRHSVHTAVTPVLATALGGAAESQQWLMAGAQDALESGPEPERVLAALERHVVKPVIAAEAPAESLRSAARLAALKASGLLDAAADQTYDGLTRLVTRLVGAPTALLSLVGKDRQFFAARTGLGEPWATQRETPLSHSFCQWVVAGKERVVISDARAHPLLRTNAAIKDMGVVAYAGVPVCSSSGEALGSLCAIDHAPREWSEPQLDTLRDLTRLVEGLAAHTELSRQPPSQASDYDRYVGAAGDALAGAVAILRRHGNDLQQAEREALLDLIAQYGHHLVQVNRMIQVTRALQ